MTLDEIFNNGKQFAKFAFEEQGEVLPMWICDDADGKHFPVMMPLEAMADKPALAEALKRFFKEKNVVRYVSILEAWTVVSKNEKEMKEVTRNLDIKPIRQHPDRKEIIFILAEDKYHSRTGIYYILRPKVGKPRLSEFQESEKSEHIEGTFTSLLDSSISLQ